MLLCLTPHGVSGLKYLRWYSFGTTSSLTPHGVSGLKCGMRNPMNSWDKSHPTRGEWIEIELEDLFDKLEECLTPHGVSGLKSIIFYQEFIKK